MANKLSLLLLLSFACTAVVTPPASDVRLGFSAKNFDLSVRPCDDFYQYADGGWIASHPIPADESGWYISSEAVAGNEQTLREVLQQAAAKRGRTANEQKLGDFYASCLDTAAIDAAGLTPIEPELQRIDAAAEPRDLQDVFAHLAAIGISAPFAFGSAADPRDSRQVIAELAQGGLGLCNPDDYLADTEDAVKLRAAYENHVASMLRLAGVRGDAAAIVRLETALARASLTRKQRRSDAMATVHPMSIDELSRLAPSIDWRPFFAAAGAPDLQSVNAAEPEFVRVAAGLLATVSVDDWRGYLRWRLIQHFENWLPSPIAAEAFRFRRTLTGQTEQQARWRECVAAADEALGEALGQEYVARRFSPEAKRRVNEIADNIIAAMREDLSTVDWMSNSTRAEAVAKVDAVTRKIGYPDRWRDYSALEIARRPFAANVLAADAFEVRRDLGKIGKTVDRGEWEMTPQTWNAYNNYEKNEIVFPAGILQWPRFDPAADDAFNYGSIGAVIGHELTHGFDDSGRQRDAHGDVRNWWTAGDAKNFDDRAACIIKQFSELEAAPGLHHDGKLVAGESIADLGGLAIAWNAWQRSLRGKPRPPIIDGFTPEQRFFFAYAQGRAANMRPELVRRVVATDTHPISRLRVNGPLSNMPEFAAAFGCRAGDPMVRTDRCKIW